MDATSERARSSNPASRSGERSEATVLLRFESRHARAGNRRAKRVCDRTGMAGF
ncbi:hypothetical protein GOC83_12630 [Haloarcula rubripromontorii]|uniref:Uncharacterized protein n=1 Tax=Haloarcula rubripromontorii TaxID=1705562 RepID=A0A847U0Z2_9EURY|nr:hypothetical protein [Haloarcula rubripromontorii]NLV06975.1 hypothetical protein [Haloarcula rubripromontorii]